MELTDHQVILLVLGIQGLSRDDRSLIYKTALISQLGLVDQERRSSVWLCELRFVTDGKLFRDPFAILAANSPGWAQQGVTIVTAESKFDKIFHGFDFEEKYLYSAI